MGETRVHLKAVRALAAKPTSKTVTESLDSAEEIRLSRRSLLQMGGAGLLASSPLLRATATTLRDDFTCESDSHSFRITYAGQVRWSLDARSFSGNARLSVVRASNALTISLSDALYAGTTLPADFKATIKPGISGSRIELWSALASKESSCNFEQWLLGQDSLSTSATLDFSNVVPGTSAQLDIKAKTRITLVANKHELVLESKDLCQFNPYELSADVLRVFPGLDESFVNKASLRRTRIVVERSTNTWNVAMQQHDSAYWSLEHDSNVFDRLVIDCAERRSKQVDVVALFDTRSEEAVAIVQPNANTATTAAAHLAIAKPKLACVLSSANPTSSLIAEFSSQPVWLHQPGYSVQVGNKLNTPPFELHTQNSSISRVLCQPSILRVQPHLGDAVARPSQLEHDELLCFQGEGAIASIRAAEQRFEAMEGVGDAFKMKASLVDEDVIETFKSTKRGYQIAKVGKDLINIKIDLELPSLSIIRPRDLLVLTFYYDNFSIRSSGSGAQLVPSDSTKSGTIVVEFPPQNIIEQAFYETKPSDSVKTGIVYNPVTKTESSVSGDGNEALPQPPIKSRISGKSRLAFTVPKNQTINLSLEALLNWTQWTPSLVPVAQRQDSDASSSFKLYPGLLSYLAKQGVKFKPGSFINEISGAGASVSMTALEEGMTAEGLSKVRSSGIEFSPKYGTTKVKASKNSSRKAGSSAPSFAVNFNYSTISTKYNGGFFLMKPKIRKPEDTETALELPYRLFLSPLNDGGWAHSTKERTRSLTLKTTDSGGVEKSENVDFTELWHTRLWFRTKKSDGSYVVNERDGNYQLGKKPKLRAVWSYDFTDDQTKPSGTFPTWSHTSLTSADRWAIVVNSSDYYTKTTNPKTGKPMDYDPKAIDSDKLFLSSIGAWIDVHGAWDPVPSNIDVVDWIHRGTMGREHYVRVMYRGYLFPFGHKCTLVKITERKFGKPNQRGTYGAYMRQRMFVIVRQPDMVLDDTNTLFDHQGREIPFKKVHIKTVVTPNLDDPNVSGGIPGVASSYGYPDEFYIRVGSQDFLFHCTATDWDGNQVDFVIPMAFVLGSLSNTNPAQAEKIISYYNSLSDSSTRKTVAFNAARIAYGPSKDTGDTTLETNSITLNAGNPATLPKDVTWFFPKLASAKIRHQDIENMTGQSVQPVVSFVDKFLEEGFDSAKNAGEAFLKFATQLPLSFGGSGGGSSDKSGGFVSPNQALSGLSRAIGPISGAAGNISGAIDKFADSSFTFDPKDFLGALDAKIFGVISLFDIIQLITGSDPRTTLLPQLLSKVIPNLGTDPSALLTKLQNDVYAKLKDSYDSAYADASSSASSVMAKLQEMKDLLDGLKSHLDDLSTAISSASGTGDIFTALTTTLPEFLNWIDTNIGPLGIIPPDALSAIEEVAKVLENMKNGIRIGFDWKPRMQADEYGFFVPQNPDDTFALSAYAMIPLSNKDHTLTIGDPTAKVEGYLQNFSINLIPTVMDLVSLPIEKMGFSAEVGKKADIFCNIGSMQWRGPLSFVNELQKFIPLDGFIDPPSIDVDTTGIKISFDLAIPTISVGVFAITNISLGAALQLPFLGDSMLFKFEFCKADSPFHVTYMMLGGGGYFGLTLSLNGIEKIEAAIEIGAELALDFGVASGSVSIFAGIYFSIESDVVTLKGYVKIHGEVDVLGLISASITLEMTITYISTGKLYGTATLTIEIHLFIFSGSVDITVEKYFKGSAGDPTISQMVPDALYPGSSKKYFELYVSAFA